MGTSATSKQPSLHCLLCGSSDLKVFYEIAAVPASCNLLWTSKEAAINCTKGSIKLAFCPNCSFIANYEMEPEKNQYGSLYDNSLFYSPHFQNCAIKLANQLVRRYSLNQKNILEIGCGKVDFLTIFCELGNNKGLRLNPATTEDENRNRCAPDLAESTLKFQGKSTYEHKIDFVFSYHELEHMNYPESFLSSLRRMDGINSSTKFFFAVPNAKKAFEKGDFTDIIYEHVSYFTASSLRYLFSNCGFDISELTETENEIFDSIYIHATLEKEKKPVAEKISPASSIEMENYLLKFASRSKKTLARLRKNLTRSLNQGKRIVVWGAGARGVTILNSFKDPRIEYAVDINPNKQGKYVPGTGQRIVKPEFLAKYRPDFIILANPAYRTEIEKSLNSLRIETKYFPTRD